MKDISWDTKRLFMAEINNEKEGGVSPSTLWSALDSLKQGYKPFEGFLSEFVEKELRDLIKEHGEATEVEIFLADEDWNRHSLASPYRRG